VIHHARHVPFSNQVMVDEDELMEIIPAPDFRFRVLADDQRGARVVDKDSAKALHHARITDDALDLASDLERPPPFGGNRDRLGMIHGTAPPAVSAIRERFSIVSSRTRALLPV